MIASELTESKSLNDLNPYCPEKQDKISKFIHLLHLETEGKVRLNQERQFGEIKIEPLDIPEEQSITIKDQYGEEYLFNWNDLKDNQRNKIIADIKANKILCREV